MLPPRLCKEEKKHTHALTSTRCPEICVAAAGFFVRVRKRWVTCAMGRPMGNDWPEECGWDADLAGRMWMWVEWESRDLNWRLSRWEECGL